MISEYSKYLESTGAVLSHHTVYGAIPAATSVGVATIEGHINTSLNYVVNGQATPRPQLTYTINKTTFIADGQDSVLISGLPSNCRITWPDGFTETDTSMELKVDLPGDYIITLDAFPYLKEVINVTAIAPA